MAYPLTIVMIARNIKYRGFDRVVNSFKTLENQTFRRFRVTLVDGSNSPEESKGLIEAAEQFSFVDYIHRPTSVLSKPYLYNSAIRECQTKFIMNTDVDYLFAPNFVKTVIKTLKNNPNAFVLCQTHDIPEGTQFNTELSASTLDILKAFSKPHPLCGDGTCQAATRRWWHKVRGYDERMLRLGKMDNDMHKRAKIDKRDIVWIQDKTFILHQWHPKGKWKTPEGDAQHKINAHIYKTDESIIRNNKQWGTIKPKG